MSNLIESFGEIHHNHVHLSSPIGEHCDYGSTVHQKVCLRCRIPHMTGHLIFSFTMIIIYIQGYMYEDRA